MDYVYCFSCGSSMSVIKKPHEVKVAGKNILLDLNCYHCDRCQTEGYSQDMENENDESIKNCKLALRNEIRIIKRCS